MGWKADECSGVILEITGSIWKRYKRALFYQKNLQMAPKPSLCSWYLSTGILKTNHWRQDPKAGLSFDLELPLMVAIWMIQWYTTAGYQIVIDKKARVIEIRNENTSVLLILR